MGTSSLWHFVMICFEQQLGLVSSQTTYHCMMNFLIHTMFSLTTRKWPPCFHYLYHEFHIITWWIFLFIPWRQQIFHFSGDCLSATIGDFCGGCIVTGLLSAIISRSCCTDFNGRLSLISFPGCCKVFPLLLCRCYHLIWMWFWNYFALIFYSSIGKENFVIQYSLKPLWVYICSVTVITTFNH